MLEGIELGLFALTTAIYGIAWGWHLRGWRHGSAAQTRVAVRILWVGWLLHVTFLGLRWVRADHVPMLSAYEFVTFFAMLVIGVFLLFAVKERNQALGVFLLPVGLGLMIYAAFMPKAVEPELQIFNSLLLKSHILITLLGYAAWAVTFAASVSYLYLERTKRGEPGMFDRMAYRAAFFAFAFLTLGPQGDLVLHHLADLPGLSARPLHAGLAGTAGRDPGDRRFRRPGIYLRGRGLPAAADSRHTLTARGQQKGPRSGALSCCGAAPAAYSVVRLASSIITGKL
jgi:hypothetical protein